MSKILTHVRGEPVTLNDDGSVSFRGGMTIDCDGSPRAYAPAGSGLPALDYLANAGHPGNWWGIAVNQDGDPYVQSSSHPLEHPNPGYYISTTSYERKVPPIWSCRRYLNSETVPFIVVPAPLRRMVKGVVLGCRAEVVFEGIHGFADPNHRALTCVVGDFGPATHLGEASMAVADFFGINSNPKHGGTDEKIFTYTFFPGETVTINGETFELIPA